MPLYEFACLRCENEYEVLTGYDETGKYKKVKCPQCKSVRKEQILSASSFNFTNPEGTDRWNSADKGHDYRFKHKQPSVKKEREDAARHSKVGAQPYNPIDDISGGKHFGEVK